MNLRPGYDWIAPYYRDLALTLVLGMTPKDHILSVLQRAADPNSGGRQMPAHYGCRRLNIISTGSSVGTQLIHACGIALASRMRGEDAVTFTSIGEGGTSEGDFHEALNFAATHKLAVIFLVENNGFAISVPWQKQMPTPDVADRAKGYGIPGVIVDGCDAIACYRVAREAVKRARRGDGPTLIEAKVLRLTSHSSDDDQRRYRTSEELESDKEGDSLLRFKATLEELGVLAAGEAEELRAELVIELNESTEEAEESPLPAANTAMLHVYAEPGDWRG
jgi:2-oxoisovalerate dehydrogenase E1 component alpha subunit